MTETPKPPEQLQSANTSKDSEEEKKTPDQVATEERTRTIQSILQGLKSNPNVVDIEEEEPKTEPTWEYFRELDFNRMCPKGYREIDFTKLPCDRGVIDEVFNWFPSQGKGLLLHGDWRSGKTRMAWNIIRREFMKNKSVMSYFSTVFTDKAIAAHVESRAANFYEKHKKPDILFIDDLGKGRISPRAAESLFTIIDFRICENKPTVLTTNYVGESLKGRIEDKDLAEALIHRLREAFVSIQVIKKKEGKKQ